jgi:hypothetical protein
MKTVMELVQMVRQGKTPVVQFKKGIESKDDCYPEEGMRARVLHASDPDPDGCVKIVFDFEEFADHNKQYERTNYYDKHGRPSLTAREAGFYKPQDDIYFDGDEEMEGQLAIQAEAGLWLYESFTAEKSGESYVQWLERKLIDAVGQKPISG